MQFAKRTAAKFRSMDLTSQSLNRITNKLSDNKKMSKDWPGPQQDILADLKEASLEGGNSISLSPQRSAMPDLNSTPGTKIQTLKKSRI